MPKFFNKEMGELALQLTRSPRRLRVGQLRSVGALLGDLDATKTYPYDFVCFRITGYRKRAADTGSAIPGEALVRDLVTLAETCSREAKLSVTELGETYQTHQQLSEMLDVSTKTIRRWRDRGLMGLRANFEDGINRLAFCKSTVDRFVANHKDLIERAASFKQLATTERSAIIERARELIATRPLKLHAVACAIAEETGRAIETVRYTLRRYDETAEVALFTRQGEPVCCERRSAMWRCHKAGETVASIARGFDCADVEVEQLLREMQFDLWRREPIEFMDNEIFAAPNADEIILDIAEPKAPPASKPRIPRDLPAYLRALYMTPLLNREQEQDLFRRYNYTKYKAAKAIEGSDQSEAALERVNALLAVANELKQRIIKANLRLVISIAKKHVGWTPNFFEVISDGNVSLMRAVEKFDFGRGIKFSTYATWAIAKNYARSIPEERYRYSRYITGQDELLEQTPPDAPNEAVCADDRVRVREMIDEGINTLPDREREIVRRHFGLTTDGANMTLEQLGTRFGVTKERIRQLEKRALQKLREVLPPSLVSALDT